MLKLWTKRFSWRLARRFLMWLSLGGALFFLFLWRLGNLTTGMSAAEAASRSASRSLDAISQNPVNAPHKLLQFGVQTLGHHGAFWLRGVSVIFGLVFLLCLYGLLKIWFGRLIAFFGVVLVGATPMFILATRSATATIMLVSPLAIIATFVWLVRTERWPNTAWLSLCLVSAVACYVPGVIWLIAAGAIFGRRRLMGKLEAVSQASLFAGVTLFFILLVPMAIVSFHHPNVAKELLLVPESPSHPADFISRFGWALSALVWKAQNHTDLILARLPLLSATQIVLSAFGFYALAKRVRGDTYFLATIVGLALVAVAIGNRQNFILFSLPGFALAAVAGLRFLHREWQSVFPRNPLPRYLAIGLMGLLVAIQFVYGARYALVAWPHTTETKSTYVLK